MLYLNLVRNTYIEAIALNKNINSDLRSALKTHERMPLLFHNVALELEKVQDLRASQNKPPIQEKTMKEVIYNFVDMFIAGIEAEAESRRQSEFSRIKKLQDEQRQKDLDATAMGTISGVYEDIFEEGGITQTSDRSVL